MKVMFVHDTLGLIIKTHNLFLMLFELPVVNVVIFSGDYIRDNLNIYVESVVDGTHVQVH